MHKNQSLIGKGVSLVLTIILIIGLLPIMVSADPVCPPPTNAHWEGYTAKITLPAEAIKVEYWLYFNDEDVALQRHEGRVESHDFSSKIAEYGNGSYYFIAYATMETQQGEITVTYQSEASEPSNTITVNNQNPRIIVGYNDYDYGYVSYEEYVQAGSTVTFYPHPYEGYQYIGAYVSKLGSTDIIPVTNNSFVMPNANVSIYFIFAPSSNELISSIPLTGVIAPQFGAVAQYSVSAPEGRGYECLDSAAGWVELDNSISVIDLVPMIIEEEIPLYTVNNENELTFRDGKRYGFFGVVNLTDEVHNFNLNASVTVNGQAAETWVVADQVFFLYIYDELEYPQEHQTGVAGFVERLYTVALNRPSEAGGKANWINALTSRSENGGAVARFFCTGQEMINRKLSNEDYVTMLYHLFFDRAPDSAGFNDWVTRLNQGASRESIIDGFVNSIEWANVCVRYGIDSGGTALSNVDPSENVINYVRRLYDICLHRGASEEEIDYWARDIANRRRSATEAAYGFVFSNEFINSNYTNEEFVTRMYQTFIGRDPDQAGFNDWLGRMSRGASREEVFYGFSGSNEFRNICESYGITP